MCLSQLRHVLSMKCSGDANPSTSETFSLPFDEKLSPISGFGNFNYSGNVSFVCVQL